MDIDNTHKFVFSLSFHPFLSSRGVIATQLAFTFGTDYALSVMFCNN